MDYTIIPFDATHWPFIYNTWLMSYYHGQRNTLPYATYKATQHQVIKRLLAKSVVKVQVAVETANPDRFLGYVVAEPDTLHWLYVRREAKNQGIGTQLLRAAGFKPGEEDIFHTHQTQATENLKEHWRLVFIPQEET